MNEIRFASNVASQGISEQWKAASLRESFAGIATFAAVFPINGNWNLRAPARMLQFHGWKDDADHPDSKFITIRNLRGRQ